MTKYVVNDCGSVHDIEKWINTRASEGYTLVGEVQYFRSMVCHYTATMELLDLPLSPDGPPGCPCAKNTQESGYKTYYDCPHCRPKT